MDRNACLKRNLDKKKMHGIEIGPFHNPIAPRAEGWKTTIIDFRDGEGLREVARNHPAESMRNTVHKIEDVDIVWAGQPLDEVALKLRPKGYDYFIASHVIEHTPNLVGFLTQISKLLTPNGILSLAVPDMRRCFDVIKVPTDLTQVLAAHRENRKIHSPETMFSAWAYASHHNENGSWLKDDVIELGLYELINTPYTRYLAYVENMKNGMQEYVDAHAWHFTPSSFELICLELAAVGLIDFYISSLDLTIGAEFIVQMKRGELQLSRDEIHHKRVRLMKQRHYELMEVKFA